jgi:hypothetical protein
MDVGEWSDEDAYAEYLERQSDLDGEDGGDDDNAMAESAFYMEEFGLDDDDDDPDTLGLDDDHTSGLGLYY